MKMKNLTVLLVLCCSVLLGNAQTTGSFKLDIAFDKADYKFTRSLYFFVPSDYDDQLSYKLVVGFRGGPHSNAGQFRDQLAFFSDSLGAIIVCPENSAHFNNDEGLVKQLFKYSVDTVKSMYNIDDDYIYLTGLSYGGRHAVIVSMDTENGPIPNLRGVIPFATGSNGHQQPDYNDIADFPPACICIGLNDNATFKNVATVLHGDIQASGGSSFLNEIPNVGHTVEFATYPKEMMECITFIENEHATSSTPTQQKRSIKIYPNPSNQKIEISLPESTNPIEAYLLDLSGKRELNIAVVGSEIDVSHIKSGLKTLVLITRDEVITKQVSIIH